MRKLAGKAVGNFSRSVDPGPLASWPHEPISDAQTSVAQSGLDDHRPERYGSRVVGANRSLVRRAPVRTVDPLAPLMADTPATSPPAKKQRKWQAKFRDAFRGLKLGVRGHSSFSVHFFFTALTVAAG